MRSTRRPVSVLLTVFALCAVPAAAIADEEPLFPAEQIEFFEKSIRPLLADNCFECHGPGTQQGNLRLDHRSFLLKGGDSGPAIVPANADESLLVEAINYASYEMPPTGKLKPHEIALLTKWISIGAPWPAEPIATTSDATRFDLEERKQHWSFQPITAAIPPAVDDNNWPHGAIDRYVLAKLDAAGLKPAVDADRRTLLRRVYFDLVGLPPPRERIAAFLADDSPQAFESVVDELLASPQFGERWGRHWLDLVRYGETLGHEFDYPIHYAWRYRDYVVRALNADVPYDQFVREHIAGDLLTTPRQHPTEGYNESIIATGFWHLHEDKHAPVDVRLAEAERYENQIDVFSKTFLGLTVACARCHDHKFDPITAADYYALAGFLKSSRRQVAYLDPQDEITRAVTKLRDRHEFVSSQEAANEPPPGDEGDLFEDFDGDRAQDWIACGWAFGNPEPGTGSDGIVHSGRLARQLTGALRSKNFTIEHDAVLIRVAGENARLRLVVDGYQMDVFSPLLFKDLTQTIDTGGEWTWLRIEGDLPNHKGHRGYFELLDDGDGWIAVDEIRFTNGEAGERGKGRSGETGQLAVPPSPDPPPLPIPDPVRIHAMQDGPACDEELFIRGNHEKTAGPVPRRFLEAIAGSEQPPIETGSGRLELADRVLAESNPFPARVMANRVWQHLFGEGIVRSVDNFGVLGDEPTHPELLDHLAEGFRRDGWSIKRLIRRIVLSRTYQMASMPHPDSAGRIADIDPTNWLLHSQRIRRLEGEAIRDAILAVSGRLDRRIGGESVPVHLTEFMQGRGRPSTSGPLDGNGRRSLYIRVQRNFLTPMLTAFDYPPPATTVGRRNVSNVPAQALILLNDPFVIEQARIWARHTLASSPASATGRIQSLYEAAYSRKPTHDETAAAITFLESHGGDWRANESAWAGLCHVLFNGKEFVFVR